MISESTSSHGNVAVLRRLVEQLPAAAVFLDGERVFQNRAAESITGYARGELPTLAEWFARLYPGRGDAARALYLADRDQHFPAPRTVGLVRKDGDERLVEFAASREQGAEIWLLRDVTEARRVSRLLEQTTRATRVGGWELDCRTGRLFWTQETYRLHEVDPSDYTPDVTSALAFYAPESVPVLRAAVQRGMETGEGYDLELEFITARGRRIWVRAIGVAEREEGRTVRVYGSLQDVSDRKWADETLRRSEEHQRRLIAASPDCLLELDLLGRILSTNELGVELFGLGSAEEALGRAWLDRWPAESRALAEQALGDAREGRSTRFQAAGPNARCWDVQIVPLPGADGRPERLLADARDITVLRQAEEERQRFERKLLQTQKLESLGIMAGGIAHDFNNLLTGIMGNAELVRLAGDPQEAGGYLAQIDAASSRAADLCRQMLAYAGKGRFVIEPIDLAGLIRKAVALLHASIPRKASLSVCLPERLPAVRADAAQISQVVINLVVNAAEALHESEGLIAVGVRVEEVAAGGFAGGPVGADAPAGSYVCLEVSDTGCGMDESTKARIFEPFFTTKFTGRGLGLAAVLGIVRSHGGALLVTSRPGRGTSVRVYFPPAADPAPMARESLPWRGGGMLLVIDDEEMVRQATAAMAGSLGFEVIQAGDGLEAMRRVEETPALRVVLLDWTMPRLDGARTLRLLRQARSDLPVIVMSGHSQGELKEKCAGLSPAGYLQKPFALAQLRERLSALVASSS